jgi:hypothetical protein
MEMDNLTNLILPMALIMIIFVIFSVFLKDSFAYAKERFIYMDAVDRWVNDTAVEPYVEKCESSVGTGQVSCILEETEPVYKYTNESVAHMIRSPSDYIKLGGVCKDSAVFYGVIFKQLGWNVNFRFPVPRHVSLTISRDTCNFGDRCWMYCDVEGNRASCYEVNNGVNQS